MPLILPHLDRSISIVDENQKPSPAFHSWWQQVVTAIKNAFNRLEELVLDIEAAIVAAGIAIDAAADAQASADAAQAAADAAEGTGAGAERIASLTNSGTIGLTLSAADAGTDVTITISTHTRAYGNGDSVSVTGDSITGLLYSTFYYVYYDDPTRAGGAVAYNVTTSETDAVQTGDRHLVGAVTTPAALDPDTDGKVVRPPGVGNIDTQ